MLEITGTAALTRSVLPVGGLSSCFKPRKILNLVEAPRVTRRTTEGSSASVSKPELAIEVCVFGFDCPPAVAATVELTAHLALFSAHDILLIVAIEGELISVFLLCSKSIDLCFIFE